jgi:starch-binding outer membrane protein, SusD/RagB family
VIKNGNGTFTYTVKEALGGKDFQQQHYWFPIPVEEINASNGAIEQNPLYN